jgi:hypothetical protein
MWFSVITEISISLLDSKLTQKSESIAGSIQNHSDIPSLSDSISEDSFQNQEFHHQPIPAEMQQPNTIFQTAVSANKGHNII